MTQMPPRPARPVPARNKGNSPAGRVVRGGIRPQPAARHHVMKAGPIAAVCAVLITGAPPAGAALGTIAVSISPSGPLAISDTFTVSLSISGYTETTEIDAYQFVITYPSSLFSFTGPFDHGSSSGPNQQWLSMTNQESAANGYAPSAADNGSVAGTIVIDYADLGFSVTEGGTNSASGFLVSFDMQAIAAGTGSFTPAAPAGGVTFFDVDLINAGSPSFSGAGITVVPEPAAALLAGAALLTGCRRRRRC